MRARTIAVGQPQPEQRMAAGQLVTAGVQQRGQLIKDRSFIRPGERGGKPRFTG